MLDEGELTPKANVHSHSNARDSLSPMGLWSEFGEKDVMKYLAFADHHRVEDDVPYQVVVHEVQQPEQSEQQTADVGSSSNSSSDINNNNYYYHKNDLDIENITFPRPPSSRDNTRPTSPAVDMAAQACEPRSPLLTRSRRPFQLELDDSRGATSLSSSDLRSLIRSTSQTGQVLLSSRVQVINHDTLQSPITSKGRKKYSQTQRPLYGATLTVRLPSSHNDTDKAMGNQHSHHAGQRASSHTLARATYSSSEETESSVDSVLDYNRSRPQKSGQKRSAIAMLKKRPSTNATKGTAAAVSEVPRAATAPNLDVIEDVGIHEEEIDPQQKIPQRVRHSKTLSAPSPALPSPPGSPDTITEQSAARPMSAGTTITALSGLDHDGRHDSSTSLELRVSALSPTIPTPSPVLADSPHQYGLKDFTDTPSPAVDAKKIKRRSNGVDMFNDARGLQTAASFLNGLSNARRRAESRTDSRTRQRYHDQSNASLVNTNLSSASLAYAAIPSAETAFYATNEASHAQPPSPESISPPLTPNIDNISRTLGHTHKSSGFAYAKALSVVQLSCYRNHDRLLRSGNTHYPIECAICHRDEPGDYFWSCCWCAVRMCGGCRNMFREHGVKALKEKIRFAEYGAVAASA